jgi:hypothetical protein
MKVYLNNPRLKAAGETLEFEPWQVKEIMKCYKDPIYFIENYVKIVHIDKGLVPFKLYDFQKKMVSTITENRHVIMTLPRQSGKCLEYSTFINIRNAKNGEIIKMEIGNFYEWQQFREQTRRILEEHNILSSKKKNS